jgi:hypothetical protein
MSAQWSLTGKADTSAHRCCVRRSLEMTQTGHPLKPRSGRGGDRLEAIGTMLEGSVIATLMRRVTLDLVRL